MDIEQVRSKCVFCGNGASGQIRKWASECGVIARAAIAAGLWERETTVDFCLNCDNTQRVERNVTTGQVYLQGSTRPARGSRATRTFYADRDSWNYKPVPLSPQPEKEYVITDSAPTVPSGDISDVKVGDQEQDNLPVRRATLPDGAEATIEHRGD